MKFYLLLLGIVACQPFSFGQLFPQLPKLHGDIEQITEKSYGRAIYIFGKYTGLYLPAWYSGWKTIYRYGNNNNILRVTSTFKGRLRSDYAYTYDTSATKLTVYCTQKNLKDSHLDNSSVDEYILSSAGRVEKLNIWSKRIDWPTDNLLRVEEVASRNKQGEILSYYQYRYDRKGNMIDTALYEIYYDSSSRIIKVERKAVEFWDTLIQSEADSGIYDIVEIPISKPKLVEVWNIEYDSKGQIKNYITRYFGGVRFINYGPGQPFLHIFEYDRKGNWIRKYSQVGTDDRHLESKRKIKYK